jgi:hypothetical protein
MKNIEQYTKRTEEIFNSVYSNGYKDGYADAKAEYSNSKGVAHCQRATKEEIQENGIELQGWCDCGKPIEGRWIGMANFCPWCGKIMEWD